MLSRSIAATVRSVKTFAHPAHALAPVDLDEAIRSALTIARSTTELGVGTTFTLRLPTGAAPAALAA